MTVCAFITGLVYVFLRQVNSKYRLGGSIKCEVYERIKGRQIYGVVKAKYIDKNNHGVETIDLLSNGRNFTNYYLNADRSDFFQFVEAGDSIFKEINSSLIMVLRDETTHKFQLYFGCND